MRKPYEILDTFRPKRGAAYLGNFASMGAPFTPDTPKELRDVVATLVAIRVNTLKTLGAYTTAPTDQIPVTPLVVARVIESTFASSIPTVEAILKETSVLTDLRRDFATSRKRWDAAREKLLQRASADGTALHLLTPSEAKGFWSEAGRMAIQLKVILDQPFQNPIGMAWDALTEAWRTAPARTAEALGGIVAGGSEAVARAVVEVLKGAGKGVARGIWDGIGGWWTVGVLAAAGGGYYAWRRYGHGRRARGA